MAPFSKRQIGYIKAVAGVGQHRSFINYSNSPPKDAYTTDQMNTSTQGTGRTVEYVDDEKLIATPPVSLETFQSNPNLSMNKALRGALFCLNNIPLTVDETDNLDSLNNQYFTQYKFAKALTPHKMLLLSQSKVSEGTEDLPSSYSRVGEDFYLESTHIKWRFTMPDFTVASGKQPHHEYRFIVFRQRKPTLQRDFAGSTNEGQWLNFNYDLFSGFAGRRVGWSGYRKHEELDYAEAYVNAALIVTGPNGTTTSMKLTTDDLMTLPLNDADYVIMRDERFFLGAEHGKSHYETVTRFEWTDPGSTPHYNLVKGLDDSKNYDWWFLLMGTTNDDVSPDLNISVRGTTALTSA